MTTRSTVEILSVAADGSAVSFRDSEGRMQSIDVVREDSRAFARKLRRGDMVDLTYTEAVAISVDPGQVDGLGQLDATSFPSALASLEDHQFEYPLNVVSVLSDVL